MIISKIFKFDSAHKLENYKGACENLHGHTYTLVVSCSGEVDEKTGMIVDFNEIKKIVDEKILNKIDHSYLNDIIKNPTCENVLLWIKQQIESEQKLKLKKLVLYETETSFCELEC
jgi:6-pyruvoyltetrahydropterin/6-carboxytetrahydropterin synthase